MSNTMEHLQKLLDTDPVCREAWETVQQNHKYMVSRIAHEIRNPVTLINSFMQLLVHDHPEIETYPYWSKIVENMDFLCKLLTDLSAFNNAGKLQTVPTNLYTFLTSLTESIQTVLQPKGIELVLQKESAIPRIPLDPLRMQQVFSNLIRNAAEAITDGGTITIAISCDGNYVKTEVSNTGKLIPPEDLDSLFQPFVTHKKDGNGLGLAITREIIAAHNGTISVQSNLETPTTFTILLPVC